MAVQTTPKVTYSTGTVLTPTEELKKIYAQNQVKIDPAVATPSDLNKSVTTLPNRNVGATANPALLKVTTNNTPTAATNTAATTAATTTQKTNAQQGSDLMELMRQYATQQATPFSYDPNTDPSYQAALKRTQQNIDAGNAATQAELNQRGILNSTITSDRMAETSANAMNQLESEVVPQLQQQAYQQYLNNLQQQQQQFANLGSLASQYLSEDQRGIDNTNTRAQLTGNLPADSSAQSLYSQLLGLKQQAEAPGITAAERAKLSNQADGIRAMLSQMGVDISQLGANSTYNTASQITPTVRTLAGQQLDQANAQQQWENRFNYGQAIGQFGNGQKTLQAKDQEFNQNLATRQQNFNEGQQNWQNNFDMTKFNEDVRRYGLDYALQQQQVGISQQNANTSRNDSNFGRLMDIWQATGVAPAGIAGVQQGTPYSAGAAKAATPTTAEEYATGYLDDAAKYDSDTGELLNSDAIEDSILESGLSAAEKKKLYVRYGIPLPSGN